MTTEEFSNEFDTLVGAYIQAKAFGVAQSSLEFDEYEKSVFLTKAQEQVVTNLYNGKLTGDSFEQTEELRRYLSNLTKKAVYYSTDIDQDTLCFPVPEEALFITHEAVKFQEDQSNCIIGDKFIDVVPVTQDEFNRIKENPFRSANRRRVLRLDIDGTLELISSYPISEYHIRYIAKPEPIILIDLDEGLSINDISTKTECKLNPAIHRIILDLAVSLALASRSSAGKQ